MSSLILASSFLALLRPCTCELNTSSTNQIKGAYVWWVLALMAASDGSTVWPPSMRTVIYSITALHSCVLQYTARLKRTLWCATGSMVSLVVLLDCRTLSNPVLGSYVIENLNSTSVLVVII